MTKILIVEDYPSLQQIYSMALKSAGYEVSVAGDGNQARTMAIKGKPNLILLDMLMPDLGGLEFLKAYDPKKHPETKIIVFSNLDKPELKQSVHKMGVEHYLIKAEFTPSELLVMIEKVLKEKSKPTKTT